MEIVQVQLRDPVSFIRVTARIWVRGYLQEQTCFKDNCATKAEEMTAMKPFSGGSVALSLFQAALQRAISIAPPHLVTW